MPKRSISRLNILGLDIGFDFGQTRQLQRNLQKAQKDFRDNPAYSEVLLSELASNLILKLRAMTPTATGRLAQSTVVRVAIEGDTIVMDVGQSATNMAGAPYQWYAASGRGPGFMPPVVAIQEWLGVKGIVGGDELHRAAFKIARRIGLQGTDPKPSNYLNQFMAEAQDLIADYQERLSKSVLVALNEGL